MAIDEAALKIDRLMLAGRLESALRLVDETVEEIGNFDEAEELRSRIVSDFEKTTRTLDDVEHLIDAALAHSAEDRFSEANANLESARELAANIAEAIEIVVEGENEIRRRIDAHRRLVAIDKAVTCVERQLDMGTVDEAQRKLAVARRLYGSSEVFDELDSKIDSKGRELRRMEIDRLVERALEADRPFDEVFADLESAAALDPHNELVQRVLVETEAAQRRFQELRAAKNAAEALARVDHLIAEGQTEIALSTLEEAILRYCEFRAARLLRNRLESSL